MRCSRRFAICAALWICSVQLWGEEDVPLLSPQGPANLHDLNVAPPGDEARKELSVSREDNFKFAQEPRISRNGGGQVFVDFETAAFCDATVAIENANSKVVRHLASGVLGDNAPAPFKKKSKAQHLIWDGKDDYGNLVDDIDALVVRVSLGLKATYEKNLHCHPKLLMDRYPIIHSSPEGVFVYSRNINNVWDSLVQFDHDGNYVKTLHPFPADKLDKIEGLKWIYAWPEQRKVPAKYLDMYGSLLPFATSLYSAQPAVADFTVRNGWITLIGLSHFVRLKTDCTSGNMIGGPSTLSTIKHCVLKSYARRSTESPDGKWIYLTRAYAYKQHDEQMNIMSVMDHAVYRMPTDGSAPPQVFLGEPEKSGSDNNHFNTPSGIAVDPQGRIYVSDWDNDRVQIYSSDGKFLQTVPSVGPADIAINQKTGDVYVFSWILRPKAAGYASADETRDFGRGPGRDGDYNLRGSPARVKKLQPFDAGLKLVYEQNLLVEGKPLEHYAAFATNSRVEIDSWAPQPTLWWVRQAVYGLGWSRVCVLKEENNKLTQISDFEKEVENAGIQSKFRGPGVSPLQRQFLFFDSKHQVLYVGEPDQQEVKYFDHLLAIDIVSGRERVVPLPFPAADAAIDAQGRIYLLDNDMIGRFDLENWAEVPFDYGRNFAKKYLSLVQTIGGHWSSYKHQSIGVSPQGNVIVAGYKGTEIKDLRADKTADYGTTGWKPLLFPGRPTTDVCVNVFNSYGELAHEDVLAGIGCCTGGLDLDWQGNIYAAVPAARVLDKQPMKFCTGTLARFGPDGGRFLSTHAVTALDRHPDTPSSLIDESGGDLWITGSQWLFGGTPMGLMYQNCKCRQARFKTDYFGRSFVPEAWRYSVAVVDSAGNVVMRIGKYGNVDSSGPKSMIPLGGDEIGLFDAQFVAVDTDRRVFIGDQANGRIVSGLLGYHTDSRIALKEIPNEAKN